MEKTHVAIVGMGTVGSGVARLLLDHGDRLARHAGRVLWLNKALVRDLSKDRGISGLPAGVLTDDLQEILDNPQIQVVAHLIGGIEPARTIMLKLLESGKDVVTANKALLAQHGEELFDRARSLGRTIAFEASVGGGIPIIANITQCFTANQIISLQGIASFLTQLGINEHYQSVSRGVLDTRDLIYFLSFTALFLFLSKTILGAIKW
jgi:homoserine dehydrogenase